MSYNVSLGLRVQEEAQLLAEEKWLLDALNKIKTQRNCLQIERLQLESMKSQLKNPGQSSAPNLLKPIQTPVQYSVSMVQDDNNPTAARNKLLENEATCNNEELDLTFSNSIFGKTGSIFPDNDFDIEEDDDDDDEEEDNCEDLLIDMNMFMNCTQKNDINTS